MKEITIKAKDGLVLSALYSQVEDAKACVQLVHGMCEHKERYIPFIEKLNEAGYTVVISDMRGHGKSVSPEYPIGHPGTVDQVVEDQHTVTEFLLTNNPGKKIFMFSHSMGSLTGRNYLMKYDHLISKLALSGTVAYNPGCGLGISVGKKAVKKKGPYGYNKLLYFFSNNGSFSEDVSWLSFNEENVKNYEADPLCGFKFTNLGYKTLFEMDKNLKLKKLYQFKNPDLKIRSFSGKQDRTTAGTRGVKKSLKLLNKIGYKHTSFIEFDKMKHEILLEKNAEMVMQNIINWFDEQ